MKQNEPRTRGSSTVARWLQPSRVLPLILLLAMVIRLWNIDQPKMSADESMHYFPEMQQIHQLGFDQQRRHPTDLYHATSPNPIGHPLFAVQLTNIFLQLIVPSASVARGVMAMAGVALVGMVYLLGRDLFSRRHGLVAALLAALVPLAVRYNRTMYLDSIYSLLVALLIWLLVRAYLTRQWRWFLLAGVVLGLAAATKTSAPFMVPLIIVYGAFGWWQARQEPPPPKRKERKRSRSRSTEFGVPLWAKFGAILILGFVVFYIFVDPGAYIQSIRHPVDTAYQNRSIGFYLQAMWNSRDWLLGVMLYLWTPPLLLAALGGLILLIREEWRKPSHVLVLMLLWLVSLGPLVPLHLRGLSGEHGYISFVAPVTLLASVGLMYLTQRWMTIALIIVIVVMLPATVLFGHRLMLLPYNSYLNVVDGEVSWHRPAPEESSSGQATDNSSGHFTTSGGLGLELPHGGIATL